MKTVCLDTNAYSLFRQGHAAIVKKIVSFDRVLMPVVVLGELQSGFYGGSKLVQNQNALQAFLASESVAVVAVNQRTTVLYGQITQQLRTIGKPIPTNDIWIAAIAQEQRAPLLTMDAHFSIIDGLALV
jgi:tRNA(fMet)-specific endonuclease VapC